MIPEFSEVMRNAKKLNEIVHGSPELKQHDNLVLASSRMYDSMLSAHAEACRLEAERTALAEKIHGAGQESIAGEAPDRPEPYDAQQSCVPGLTCKGNPPWTRSQILEQLDEFAALYAERPIRDNMGGMRAPHMFAVWFMARQLSPDLIIESGVWRGQSTWLLEKACPHARLVSIDPDLGNRLYISKRAVYSDMDFSKHDWLEATDRSLVFFDDHKNSYQRMQQCKWFGFRHVIFEDNYPVSQGDCYSLKKAFAHAGFQPQEGTIGAGERIVPNSGDARILHRHLEVYYEFPPVFRTERTRWGDLWNDAVYPTPQPLLERPSQAAHQLFADDAMYYTWICYAQLK